MTRYADMVALLKDNRIDPRDGVEASPEEKQSAPLKHPNAVFNQFLHLREESKRLRNHWIIVTNPPVHTRLQKVLNPAFTHRQISALEPQLQMKADQMIDKALASGTLDIIGDFATPLIVDAISEILGVPVADRTRLKPLAYDISIAIDLETPRAISERAEFALMSLTQYFRNLITELRGKAQDNLLSTLIQAQAKGELSEDELLGNSLFLFVTGQGAPQHIIGNGMLALLRHPEQLRLLQEDSTRLKTAIDECLRYDCPGQYIIRRALADIEIGGKLIQKGQKVIFVIGAANRDPDQFPEPDKFDIFRKPNKYLTFGYGMRSCMGARLAQLLAQIGMGTLVRRLPQIALETECLEWEESYRTHGLKALPVTF